MKLTQKQELLINRYLRELYQRANGDLSPEAREQIVNRLKTRIILDLNKIAAKRTIQDADVVSVLANCLRPAAENRPTKSETFKIAPPAARRRKQGLRLAEGDEARWLGVCSGIAAYLGLKPAVVRGFFLFLGLTGPVSMLIYLLVYFEMHHARGGSEIEPVNLFRRIVGFLAWALGLFGGTQAILQGMLYLYGRYANQHLLDLGNWGWILDDGVLGAKKTLICVIVLLTPPAILSGLPMVNGWDRTLQRVVQAGLAMYAVLLSLGMASALTGILLHVVKLVTTP